MNILPQWVSPIKEARKQKMFKGSKSCRFSLNYNVFQEEADHSTRNPNPVSTGLRLSYDDDERNSSITSASGSMTAPPSMIFSLGDNNIHSELELQEEEFDQYVKIQEEHLLKGVRDMKHRHTVAFLTTMEKGIGKKIKEKDLEIENMNRKNRELVEKIKQVATEAQNWHYIAKYNESIVNVLKNNLQQALSQGVEQGKEGFGDSEVDDAASYIDPNNFLSIQAGTSKSVFRNQQGTKENMLCRSCKAKEVCILLMPCRHLCLCKEYNAFVSACPVCHLMKTTGVLVFLS